MFIVVGGDRNFVFIILLCRGSEGLSSSVFVLYECYFMEVDFRNFFFFVWSFGIFLGMLYFGVCNILGSKLVVIRKYEFMFSRES